YFFFQAEDGIRDRNVTGVQTCALPIFDEIGEVMAESVIKYLNEPHVSDLLNHLKDLGINMTYTGTPLESLTDETLLFANQRIVLTGRLASFTRREAKDLIERLGG